MAADTVVPLLTWAEFTRGAYKDLVRSYTDPQAQQDLLMEATRLCEDFTGRRLAPFAGLVETIRADGIDPDEYMDSGTMPLDLAGSLGRNWAASFGSTAMIRRAYLSEYAPRYPDLWAYSDVSINIIRSYGGNEPVPAAQLLMQPAADTGFFWFALGQFLPEGSMLQAAYSGGYQTMPASLIRAGKYMLASIAVDELDPAGQQHGHDPDVLRTKAEEALTPYVR